MTCMSCRLYEIGIEQGRTDALMSLIDGIGSLRERNEGRGKDYMIALCDVLEEIRSVYKKGGANDDIREEALPEEVQASCEEN